MNLEDFMEHIDYYYDQIRHKKLLGDSRMPKDYKLKVCTEGDSWTGTMGTRISHITMGFDFDDGYILLFPEEKLYLEPKTEPIHKWFNVCNGIPEMLCSKCNGLVNPEDCYCRHCGQKFSGEIQKGIEY